MKSHMNAEIDTPRWGPKELITVSIYTCVRWILNEKYDHPLENRVGGKGGDHVDTYFYYLKYCRKMEKSFRAELAHSHTETPIEQLRQPSCVINGSITGRSGDGILMISAADDFRFD